VYLLDTNACIRLLNGDSPSLAARFQKHLPSEIHLCSIVKAELYYGARKSSRVAQNLQLLGLFFAPLACLPFDDASAETYGNLRAEQEKTGRILGPNDLMIAAIAKTHDFTLVTNNVREFSLVVGLRVEDWQTPSRS